MSYRDKQTQSIMLRMKSEYPLSLNMRDLRDYLQEYGCEVISMRGEAETGTRECPEMYECKGTR